MPGLSNQTTKIIICKETTNSGRNNYGPAEPQNPIYEKCGAAEGRGGKACYAAKVHRQVRRDIKTGARLTDKGTLYAPGTINAINQACERLKKFKAHKKHVYDFDGIDLKFYNEYKAYLKKQNYAINTTGKCIKVLKQIMALAEILSRDIFMVGVWTAQRVSDYNNISRDDIQTLTKRWIEDVPDPEHPWQTTAVIRTRDITYINIRQKKTGAKVAIPCSSDLKTILEKYDYLIPHQIEQVLNRNLKARGRKAGLDQLVEIENTKGGKSTIDRIPKYELIHSHTARRTGATLM